MSCSGQDEMNNYYKRQWFVTAGTHYVDCTDEVTALKEEVALWKERAGNASKELERLKNVDHTYWGYIMVNEDEYRALQNERERWRDSSDKKALELQSLTEDLRICMRARDKFERERDEANRAYKAAVADLEAARGALNAEHKVACQERDAHIRMIAKRDTAKADLADMSLELSKAKNELEQMTRQRDSARDKLKHIKSVCS